MLKLKEFALERPLLFSIVLMTLSVFLEIVPAKYLYFPFVNEQLASYFGEITMRVIICILLLIMLKCFGIIKMVYFTVPAKWNKRRDCGKRDNQGVHYINRCSGCNSNYVTSIDIWSYNLKKSHPEKCFRAIKNELAYRGRHDE